ncbi:hypothetical protein B7Y94_00490 [Candidatus Saccharibacteria bacterium 32-49-12]|nr:MAG: hypothetical protein B7Y94_00490 [Candidatus Saccharibacteria bacterium 32-49-12]
MRGYGELGAITESAIWFRNNENDFDDVELSSSRLIRRGPRQIEASRVAEIRYTDRALVEERDLDQFIVKIFSDRFGSNR